MSEQIHKSAIRTVAAYQTVDGQKFHTAAEAQEHTRLFLLDSIISAATKADPQFARLDHDLLRKFCRAFGKHVGEVTTEPFEPLPVGVTETALQRSRREIEEAEGSEARRIVRKAPELAMPYGRTEGGHSSPFAPLRAAVDAERTFAKTPPLERTDFGAHPLDPLKASMAAVDRKLAAEGEVATLDTEGFSDEEIAAELERAMKAS